MANQNSSKKEEINLEQDIESKKDSDKVCEEIDSKGCTNNESSEELSQEADNNSPEPIEDTQKYLRLMADFQNYKKRAEKERGEVYNFANELIVNKILDVMDNFERALDHPAEEGFKSGIIMIFDQLQEVLKTSGVEEIEAHGCKFDPNFHNAMLMEDSEDVDSGYITQVLQKGYTLKGKVIRFAMVKVAN